MATTPLMPKATAVWLVESTALSFDQIADFCKLHPLEVKAIADGDAAQGIKGLDPILTGQLTREEIEKAEKDHDLHLHISDPKVRLPEQKKKKGPRYTPVSRRQDRPNAILWLVRNHPELKDAQIMRLVGTTKSTIQGIRDRTHWNAQALQPLDPGTLGLCSQIDLDFEVQRPAKEKPVPAEGGDRGDLVRIGDAAERRARQQALLRGLVGRDTFQNVGHDRARADRVDADAIGAKRQRHHLGELVDAALRDAIRHLVGDRDAR